MHTKFELTQQTGCEITNTELPEELEKVPIVYFIPISL